MQIWAESGKSALPICNYSQILYQFLTFTQNLKRSLRNRDFLKNGTLISMRRTGDGFYPGLFIPSRQYHKSAPC